MSPSPLYIWFSHQGFHICRFDQPQPIKTWCTLCIYWKKSTHPWTCTVQESTVILIHRHKQINCLCIFLSDQEQNSHYFIPQLCSHNLKSMTQFLKLLKSLKSVKNWRFILVNIFQWKFSTLKKKKKKTQKTAAWTRLLLNPPVFLTEDCRSWLAGGGRGTMGTSFVKG